MSNNDNSLYSKPILFTIVVVVVILIGSIVTAFVPLATDEMHPKLDNLQPYTALELAGRNVYQKEGCFNCHSQTVRPLKADVLRYGDYSKAGENYYEHPFLWGSKRTGPDLARIGGKYPDMWHVIHLKRPQDFVPQSNMPKYDWLAVQAIDVAQVQAGMDVLGLPYTPQDITALNDKTQLDALVAYLQVIGTSVERKSYVAVSPEEYAEKENPFNNDKTSAERGRVLFESVCFQCHGMNGEGTEMGSAIGEIVNETTPDGQLFVSIANGLPEAGMPESINVMTKNNIWDLVSYCKMLAAKQQAATK